MAAHADQQAFHSWDSVVGTCSVESKQVDVPKLQPWGEQGGLGHIPLEREWVPCTQGAKEEERVRLLPITQAAGPRSVGTHQSAGPLQLNRSTTPLDSNTCMAFLVMPRQALESYLKMSLLRMIK